SRSVAATVMTPAQLAGWNPEALALEFPADTTTVVPRLLAELIARRYVCEHVPLPPRLRLMTLAGLALAGTPRTVPPDAQTIASAMSELVPPHLPSTRTGTTFALKATPATPMPLLATAAIVP